MANKQEGGAAVIDKQQLAEILRRHGMWLRGEGGGVRADLRGAVLSEAVLSGADLRGADLREAVLSEAVLSEAVLSEAVLSGADLRGADLRWADLREADLRGADLRWADLREAVLSGAVLPTGVRIASLCFGGWAVTVTRDTTTIGCQTHPNEDWLRWTPSDVAEMHPDAKRWWGRHQEAVCAVIRDIMQEENQ